MVDEKYIWTIKLSNGESYDVKSKENKIDEFLKTLIPTNLSKDVSVFELASPTVKGNNLVAIFARDVVSIEWKY